jgi:hypothetical protein
MLPRPQASFRRIIESSVVRWVCFVVASIGIWFATPVVLHAVNYDGEDSGYWFPYTMDGCPLGTNVDPITVVF